MFSWLNPELMLSTFNSDGSGDNFFCSAYGRIGANQMKQRNGMQRYVMATNF